MIRERDLVVVGAGAAGLAHAFWRLSRRPDLKISVLEASPRAGGWIQTTILDGFCCERGPQGFRPSRDSDALVEALGIAADVVPASGAARRRWLASGGVLHELPNGPLKLLTTGLFSFGDCLRLLKEPWIARGEDPREPLASFATRRLGRAMRPLAEAFARGIFAGNADRIEMRAAFPEVFDLEQRHGSLFRGMRRRGRSGPRVKRPVLCTFRSGMEACVAAIRSVLGDRLELCAKVSSFERDETGFTVSLAGRDSIRCRELVLATPPSATSALVARHSGAMARALDGIRCASVASVYLGAFACRFTRDMDGFGCLQPAGEGPVLGALYTSSIFPGHAPPGMSLVRVMSGGIDHPSECARGDDDLVRQAVEFARKFQGLEGPPAFARVERAMAAIPQYEPGHCERLAIVREELSRLPGLSLIGSGYRQVSVVGQWAEAGSRP
ncbi:MAG: protoporphyrinogen oxidase [Planctomycetota bacterium]